MMLGLTTVLCAAIGHDAQHGQIMCIEEWQHAIIEHIGGCNRCLSGIQLGKGDLAKGIYKGLLIDSNNAFERADIEGILRSQIARMGCLDLPTGFVIMLLAFQSGDLFLGQDNTFLGHPVFQGL